MRERWCCLVDDIMDRQLRLVQFSDFVVFVDCEVRILINLVFGKIFDIVRLVFGQWFYGGKIFNFKNFSFLVYVGDSEGYISEIVLQGVKELS